MSLLPAIIAGGASLAGSILTNKKQEKLADRQMQFQSNMSDTAHQREVKDLRAAGLNPILSAGGSGASAPSGAMATMENPLTGAASTIMQNKQLSQQEKSIDQTIDNQKEQKRKLKEDITDQKIARKALVAETKQRVQTAKAKAEVASMAAKTAGSTKQVYDALSSGNIGSTINDHIKFGEDARRTRELRRPQRERERRDRVEMYNRYWNKFKRFIGGK